MVFGGCKEREINKIKIEEEQKGEEEEEEKDEKVHSLRFLYKGGPRE